MATIIKINGEQIEVSPEMGSEVGFKLKEAQNIVDGLVQVICLKNDKIMIINEEGKFSKEENPTATQIAYDNEAIAPWDYIAGDVLVCLDSEFN